MCVAWSLEDSADDLKTDESVSRLETYVYLDQRYLIAHSLRSPSLLVLVMLSLLCFLLGISLARSLATDRYLG